MQQATRATCPHISYGQADFRRIRLYGYLRAGYKDVGVFAVPGVQFTGLAFVFHGWETVFCDARRSAPQCTVFLGFYGVSPLTSPK